MAQVHRYKFVRDGRNWYIDLPEYLDGGGNRSDLQMVDGADTMLDIVAKKGDDVVLELAEDRFPGSDKISLVEICDPLVGGGYYVLHEFEGKQYNQRMWLCAVTEYVFHKLPENIFVKRVG